MGVPHHHWAIFVDPSGAVPQKSALSSLFSCFSDADLVDFSDAVVFDIHGKKLRKRPAFQVSFTRNELPVQIVVAKPGAPESRTWERGTKIVNAVEGCLKTVPATGVRQDKWIDLALTSLWDSGVVERFDQENFRTWSYAQIMPSAPDSQAADSDVVKEVDYVEERKSKQREAPAGYSYSYQSIDR